ncbi:MAG: SufE family protein [Pseudomonadota bacterium]
MTDRSGGEPASAEPSDAAPAGAAFDEIAENFAFLEDWEERYRYLIELGRDMAPLPAALKTDGARVQGCASQVWLVPRQEGSGPAARIAFDGDSDAMIVRGLIALLRILVNGRHASDIAALDAQAEFGRLDLSGHLSAQRSNGLRAMVQRIKEIASEAAAA